MLGSEEAGNGKNWGFDGYAKGRLLFVADQQARAGKMPDSPGNYRRASNLNVQSPMQRRSFVADSGRGGQGLFWNLFSCWAIVIYNQHFVWSRNRDNVQCAAWLVFEKSNRKSVFEVSLAIGGGSLSSCFGKLAWRFELAKLRNSTRHLISSMPLSFFSKSDHCSSRNSADEFPVKSLPDAREDEALWIVGANLSFGILTWHLLPYWIERLLFQFELPDNDAG